MQLLNETGLDAKPSAMTFGETQLEIFHQRQGLLLLHFITTVMLTPSLVAWVQVGPFPFSQVLSSFLIWISRKLVLPMHAENTFSFSLLTFCMFVMTKHAIGSLNHYQRLSGYPSVSSLSLDAWFIGTGILTTKLVLCCCRGLD